MTNLVLTGEIHLGSLNPWPVTWLSPGIMGWYAWVPRMEIYHGVLSFSHSMQGTLTINGKIMNFSGGRLFGRSSERFYGLDEVGLGGVTPRCA
jgi:tocopherol cyclase